MQWTAHGHKEYLEKKSDKRIMNNRFNVCLCPVYLAPAVGIWRLQHRKEK